jgi:recombination protein RecA
MAFNSEVLKLAAQLNKKLGVGTVLPANQVVLPPRITTGSLTLDVILGGGWPMNHWVEIVGDPSHGKTALALKTIAANQAKDPSFTVVWIAAENFDSKYAEMCGVDTSRVLLVENNIMEEAFEAAIQFCESKAIDMLVIDSLPALVPAAEDEKTMDEFTVGRGALLTGKFFRKVGKATKRALDGSERPVLGIIINQYRMKIGVMHGDPRTTPGGVGKDYAYSIRCEVKRGDWLEVGTGVDKRRVGQTIRIRTIKNKTYPPQQVASTDFYFADGGDVDRGMIDTGKEIIALALIYNLIERRGGWYYYGDRKWQGTGSILESLREEIDLAEEISAAVMDVTRSVIPVLEDDDEDRGSEAESEA